MLGLEIPRLSQAMDLGWLLLVLGLGPLSKRYGGWRLTEIGYCLFNRMQEVVKCEPRSAIHLEKSLSTAWVGL